MKLSMTIMLWIQALDRGKGVLYNSLFGGANRRDCIQAPPLEIRKLLVFKIARQHRKSSKSWKSRQIRQPAINSELGDIKAKLKLTVISPSHRKCRNAQVNPIRRQRPVIINHRLLYLLSNRYLSLNFSTAWILMVNLSILAWIPSITVSTLFIFSLRPSADEYAYRSFIVVSWISRVFSLTEVIRWISCFEVVWRELNVATLAA